MTTRRKLPLEEQAKRFTTRNSEHYAKKIAEICREQGITPTKFGQMANRLMADGFHEWNLRLNRIEEIQLRTFKTLQEAVESSDE